MKKVFYALIVIAILPIVFSCSDDENIGVLSQEDIMHRFIKSQGIVVLDEYPEKHNFDKNEYYRTHQDLYIQVVDLGSETVVKPYDRVFVRFNYSINVNSYMVGVKDTMMMPSPELPMQFKYEGIYANYDSTDPNNYSCKGWAIPLDFVYEGSVVNLIIPSKFGCEKDRTDGVARFYKNLTYTKFW